MMETSISRRAREKAAAPSPSPRGRRTHEERSADTQSALVEAAIALLCELGYAGITTAEVARRAGCTTGAMQHHFGSKEDLLLAVLARLSLEWEEKYAALNRFDGVGLDERCAQVIDVLAAYYSAPRYVAVWELYVGTRCEPGLNEICVANRTRVIAAFEKVWLATFADVRSSRTDLVNLMHFTLNYLRSYGLNRSLGTDPDVNLEQMAILQDTLRARIGGTGAGPRGQTTARKRSART